MTTVIGGMQSGGTRRGSAGGAGSGGRTPGCVIPTPSHALHDFSPEPMFGCHQQRNILGTSGVGTSTTTTTGNTTTGTGTTAATTTFPTANHRNNGGNGSLSGLSLRIRGGSIGKPKSGGLSRFFSKSKSFSNFKELSGRNALCASALEKCARPNEDDVSANISIRQHSVGSGETDFRKVPSVGSDFRPLSAHDSARSWHGNEMDMDVSSFHDMTTLDSETNAPSRQLHREEEDGTLPNDASCVQRRLDDEKEAGGVAMDIRYPFLRTSRLPDNDYVVPSFSRSLPLSESHHVVSSSSMVLDTSATGADVSKFAGLCTTLETIGSKERQTPSSTPRELLTSMIG